MFETIVTPPCLMSSRPACSPFASTTKSLPESGGRPVEELRDRRAVAGTAGSAPAPTRGPRGRRARRRAGRRPGGGRTRRGREDASLVADVGHPRAQGVCPARDRPAQQGVTAIASPVAAGDAGRFQPGRHALGERGEVRVDLLDGRLARVVGDRVILVGVQCLLEPGLAAERDPCPRRPAARPIGIATERSRRGQRVDRGADQPRQPARRPTPSSVKVTASSGSRGVPRSPRRRWRHAAMVSASVAGSCSRDWSTPRRRLDCTNAITAGRPEHAPRDLAVDDEADKAPPGHHGRRRLGARQQGELAEDLARGPARR